jgi:hypothetical protein
VTTTLWLGPPLLKKVDREALSKVARLVVLEGGSLRILLKRKVDLDALEKVLSPVLASHKDWLRATSEV